MRALLAVLGVATLVPTPATACEIRVDALLARVYVMHGVPYWDC